MAATDEEVSPGAASADGRLQAAMWSLYFHGAKLSPDLVPPALRPLRLSEALRVLPEYRDEHALIRAQRVTVQLSLAAGLDPKVADELFLALGDRMRKGQVGPMSIRPMIDIFIKVFVSPLAAQLSLPVSILFSFFSFIVSLFLSGPDQQPPCSKATSKATFDPLLKVSEIESTMTVHRPLDDELAKLLDPRGWQRCSELFAETYQVKLDRCTHEPLGTVADGKSWSGYLYERFVARPQQAENILCIDFQRSAHDIVVDYHLERSLSYRVAGMTMPGVMRQNHGRVTATAGIAPRETLVTVVKTAHFGRFTSWSAGGGLDYGEVLNYVAPAFLSAWVDHVQRVVPCCVQPKPPRKRS
jgi:hypothetical protein